MGNRVFSLLIMNFMVSVVRIKFINCVLILMLV